MTDEQFRELVNLYLDKEINSEEMELLQAAISSDAARQREFDTSCRLHYAMRSALETEVASNEKACSLGRNRTCWIVGVGMAASFALGGILLTPVFTDSNGLSEAEALEAKRSAELLQQREKHVERYLAVQRQQTQQQACGLAAKLRLLGLDPALVPSDCELEPVDLTVKRVQVEWVGNEPHWTIEQIHRVGGMDNPHAVIRIERSSTQTLPMPDFLVADDFVGGFQFIGE